MANYDMFTRIDGLTHTFANAALEVNSDNFVIILYRVKDNTSIMDNNTPVLYAAIFPSKNSAIDHINKVPKNNPLEIVPFRVPSYNLLKGVFEYDNSYATGRKLTDFGKVAILEFIHNDNPLKLKWHNHEILTV